MKQWLCGLTGAMMMLVVLAGPAAAESGKVVHEADNYTVYDVRPDYCVLYLDTPEGGMIRISLNGTTGDSSFLYAHDDYPDVSNEKLPVTFQFDDSNFWFAYMGQAYDASTLYPDDNRRGYGLQADDRLLDGWTTSSQVTIRVGLKDVRAPQVFDITGGDKAIKALKSCARP